jgi:hypothetical protein
MAKLVGKFLSFKYKNRLIMKKVLFLLTGILFTFGAFATSPSPAKIKFEDKKFTFTKVEKPVKTEPAKTDAKGVAAAKIATADKAYSSWGCISAYDGCGNHHYVCWECNYECSAYEVAYAVYLWLEAYGC